MTCPTCNGRGKVWHDGITAQFFERCDRCNGTGEIVLRPAAAVPSPEVIAAMRRLKEISEYASAVLILEGDFGRRTTETAHLIDLLDAPTLPHDWEAFDTYLKGLPE